MPIMKKIKMKTKMKINKMNLCKGILRKVRKHLIHRLILKMLLMNDIKYM